MSNIFLRLASGASSTNKNIEVSQVSGYVHGFQSLVSHFSLLLSVITRLKPPNYWFDNKAFLECPPPLSVTHGYFSDVIAAYHDHICSQVYVPVRPPQVETGLPVGDTAG